MYYLARASLFLLTSAAFFGFCTFFLMFPFLRRLRPWDDCRWRCSLAFLDVVYFLSLFCSWFFSMMHDAVHDVGRTGCRMSFLLFCPSCSSTSSLSGSLFSVFFYYTQIVLLLLLCCCYTVVVDSLTPNCVWFTVLFSFTFTFFLPSFFLSCPLVSLFLSPSSLDSLFPTCSSII